MSKENYALSDISASNTVKDYNYGKPIDDDSIVYTLPKDHKPIDDDSIVYTLPKDHKSNDFEYAEVYDKLAQKIFPTDSPHNVILKNTETTYDHLQYKDNDKSEGGCDNKSDATNIYHHTRSNEGNYDIASRALTENDYDTSSNVILSRTATSSSVYS